MLENKCRKCRSNNNLQLHHITYKPLRLSYLCRECHKQITFINTYFRFAQEAKTSRLKLWKIFKQIPKKYLESEIVSSICHKLKIENNGAKYIPNPYHCKLGKQGDMTFGDYLTQNYNNTVS